MSRSPRFTSNRIEAATATKIGDAAPTMPAFEVRRVLEAEVPDGGVRDETAEAKDQERDVVGQVQGAGQRRATDR
jgi:hypothetical protein